MTKNCNRLRGERPKAFWGVLVGGAMNLIGSAISSKSQARAIRRQIEAQKEAARTQLELANNSNLASTLNSYATATRSYNDEDDYNLKYRLGGNKRLGSNRIYITDGGNATKIGNDTYLLRGGSHEQTNETGQTGIGINVGGNEVEAEGGEVAQKKNGALRIFSAQPILGNGMSPAQAILRGYNKDKVFSAQQQFKKRHHLSDDGGKAKHGTEIPYKRIHINEDGTFTDTLTGKNYNISATNGEDVVITGKANHWKEAGKKDTSSYFDPMGAVNFAIAAGTPILNGDPSNVVGSIRDSKNFNDFVRHYMMQDTGGFVNTKWANEHPYLSLGINTVGDKGLGIGANKVADILRHPLEYGKYGYKLNKLYKKAGLLVRGGYKTIQENYEKLLDYYTGNKPYDAGAIDYTYDIKARNNAERVNPDIFYSYFTPSKEERAIFRNAYLKKATDNVFTETSGPIFYGYDVKDLGYNFEAYKDLMNHNPEYYEFLKETKLPWNKQSTVDALRLAGLHGRSDVRSKVYSKYPSLRPKTRIGGSWKAPVYNTNKYRVSNRMRRQIATWEGSDFAGQNRRFKGDAIGAKERELRRIMGRTYNYLNDNQRDSLNSIYYNSRVDTFKNAFGKWFRNLNSAVDRGDERAFNNSLAGIRQSMTVGANRKGMSGLAKRRAWERNWFGNPIPIVSNETKAILKQQAEAKMVQPTDNTRVVIQPEYIEVPAPVGHGVVPVDNPDPNLLQGNIKDNLINMGNKFRLGQRCGGSTRMRKALGGESRPVKGMRRKLAWGDVTYPYRRNNNFDYWDIIDQEQKANDKGGISPWTPSNKYDIKVPYAITKSTPTIPYTSQVSTPTSGVSENKTIPTYIGNKSGMIIRDADWYGLGADLVSSIGGSILGLGAYKNLDFNYNLPNFVEESPVALNTTYHNEAQKSNVERNRLNSRNSILRNTMSGSTAVGRMQGVDTNSLYQLNQLADEKTNKETELMNQNLLNEQQVRARNAAARNQYYNTVASIKNAAIQAKNEAELAKGQILSGSLQGIGNSFQNFINQGRQNYDDTQAMLMGVAASDYATPSRLLELGVDVGDDAALAGIYRSAINIPNPGARPKREDYSDNTEYSYALTRWENQNKAYQRRNSYADLIKGRMSKKNLIKYGII